MVSEKKLRRKEEKKGLCTDTEESSKVEPAPPDVEDVSGIAEMEAGTAEAVPTPKKSKKKSDSKSQSVSPIGELPSRQKAKTGKSPRKKKKKIEEEDDGVPVEFRVNGVIVDRDVKGGAKRNWQAVLDSCQSIRNVIGDYLLVLEHGFTLFFTVEYVLRIVCLRRPSKFIFSLLGFIDICALVPSYVGYIFPEARPLLHLAVLRIFRVMRVFRLMRLARFVDASATLTDNIETNRRNIAVFLVALFTIILVIGCAMYLIEGDRQFSNIPISLYWTVVTITTVGYGDISPKTIVGQMLATMVMFVGYGIIASPTLLSSPPLAPATTEATECPKCTKVTECLKCFQQFHQESANFCCMCATPLRQPEVKALKARTEERRRSVKPRTPAADEEKLPPWTELPSTPTEPTESTEPPLEEIKPAQPIVMHA
ncbi:hypothetical protein BBJ29_000593 [Phytophthora kernoviae]|uniref:Ion transport domain-containing protein n=1 Tax=Phytophthora kernoviae TaxID=325452 RepID=A0A3F2S036_9STRA|nr:hypothetical protein BBJ29_000593 [Phytophthora kernoviae]RLN67605.1 hypothetical protein BBP00_00001520 [Phytophthora kernoviae]